MLLRSLRSLGKSATYRHCPSRLPVRVFSAMAADSRWHDGGHNNDSGSSSTLDFVDIGVNLTDDMYKGHYHGKQAHASDLNYVLERARQAGVTAHIVTAGSVQEAGEVLALAKAHSDLYATAGIHPTRTSHVDEAAYIADLSALLALEARTRSDHDGRIVAIGECGLDYDRLHFADKETQKVHFAKQLDLARGFHLPLFLHCRAAQDDFLAILAQDGVGEAIASANSNDETRADVHGRRRIGVAHCFTGNVDEMRQLVGAGLFVGLTGCSFKADEGIEVAKAIPLERLLLETDAPWCDMRPTHASAAVLAAFRKERPQEYGLIALPDRATAVKKEKWTAAALVKGRNEPCTIGSVAAVVAQAKGVSLETVVKTVRENTRFLFGI